MSIYTSNYIYLCFKGAFKNLKVIHIVLEEDIDLVAKNIVGEITINKKTGKEVKLLVGRCVICDRKKTMIVSDNVIQAEGLGSFFKNLGKISSKAGKKIAKNVLSNPGRALDLTAKIATAAATKSPKAALSTLPEVTNFYHTGKGFFLLR